MKIVKEVKNGTTFTRFVEHNTLIFRLIYDNRNGVPLGFDSRFQTQIKTSENLWHTIAGKTDVGFTPISYVCSLEQRERDANAFFKLLQEHIELIY
jgi:hypothetical protein